VRADLSTTVIVCKKTKLAETDLIITGFSEQGRQVRAVAKGARKPGSRLGAHLELYAVVRLLLHKGRSLDTVVEAQSVASNASCRADVLHSAGAAVIVELLDKVSADAADDPRLFAMTVAALASVGAVEEPGVMLVCAAAILKLSAQIGLRPSLGHCVACGQALNGDAYDGRAAQASSADVPDSAAAGPGYGEIHDDGSHASHTPPTGAMANAMPPADNYAHRTPSTVLFSFSGGGIVCDDCRGELPEAECRPMDAQLLGWANTLVVSRFKDLERFADQQHQQLGRVLLEFSRDWLRCHLLPRLKSLDFLLSFR
jgi:DNA repair protein RecO